MIYSHPNLADNLRTALCREQEAGLFALNFEMPEDGKVPEWIELLPAGEVISGRDGRTWRNPDPEKVVEMTRRLNRDLVLDWEHASHLKAPNGDWAGAAAWFPVASLEVRNGAIWGKVEWTESGANSVASRAYRYISPVFHFDKETSEVIRLTSVGLTNQPNLFLEALNREQRSEEEAPVKLDEAIRKALGLKEDATLDDAVTAINQMKADKDTALNQAQQPSLDKFVPRADYDTALNRASAAEEKLKEREQADLDGKIETAINKALEEGKITPATKDYHEAQCRQEGGLERFEKFIESAPKVADDTDMDGRQPGDRDAQAMNAEEAQVAEMFGNSAEDIAKYGA